MSGPLRRVQGEVADLAAAIERVSGDVALHEEPAGFVAALERGAPGSSPTESHG